MQDGHAVTFIQIVKSFSVIVFVWWPVEYITSNRRRHGQTWIRLRKIQPVPFGEANYKSMCSTHAMSIRRHSLTCEVRCAYLCAVCFKWKKRNVEDLWCAASPVILWELQLHTRLSVSLSLPLSLSLCVLGARGALNWTAIDHKIYSADCLAQN